MPQRQESARVALVTDSILAVYAQLTSQAHLFPWSLQTLILPALMTQILQTCHDLAILDLNHSRALP